MQSQLQKAINLIKKTGDRLMIFDSRKPDNVHVIMNLKDYENLILGKSEVRGLTEDELLDKINRDIAIWKSEQDYSESLTKTEDSFKADENISETDVDIDNQEFFNHTINSLRDRKESENKERNQNNAWSIPKNRKEAAEEVIEEDRQYLEDVPF